MAAERPRAAFGEIRRKVFSCLGLLSFVFFALSSSLFILSCGFSAAENPLRKTRCGKPAAENPLR
jgi:hypothetical protein